MSPALPPCFRLVSGRNPTAVLRHCPLPTADHATRRSHVLFSHWPIRNKLQLGLGTARSLGAHVVRQRVLRPVCLSRVGEKPQRSLGRVAAGRSSCATTSPSCTKSSTRCKIGSDSTRSRSAPPTTRPTKRCGMPTACLRQKLPNTVRPVLPDARATTATSSIPTGCAPNRRIGDDTLRTRNAGENRRRSGQHQVSTTDDDSLGLASSTTSTKSANFASDVETLRELAAELPSHLHERFRELASDVRNEYRLGDRPRLEHGRS